MPILPSVVPGAVWHFDTSFDERTASGEKTGGLRIGTGFEFGGFEEKSMDKIRELRRVTIFKDVAEPVLEIVALIAEEMTIPAGETIASMIDVHNAICIIRNGTVRACFENGGPPILFGAGETIAEAHFMGGEPVRGTVTALERVDLLVIRSRRLAEALVGHPDAGYELYRAIAGWLAGRLRRAMAPARVRQGA